jgi:hypothetical protein
MKSCVAYKNVSKLFSRFDSPDSNGTTDWECLGPLSCERRDEKTLAVAISPGFRHGWRIFVPLEWHHTHTRGALLLFDEIGQTLLLCRRWFRCRRFGATTTSSGTLSSFRLFGHGRRRRGGVFGHVREG